MGNFSQWYFGPLKSGQNIARETKRRERDVRNKRRGELRKLEVLKFISSRLQRGLCRQLVKIKLP